MWIRERHVINGEGGLRYLQDDSVKDGRGRNVKLGCHLCQPRKAGWLLPDVWNIGEHNSAAESGATGWSPSAC